MGLLLRQAKQAGLDARFMGPEGVGNSEITAIAGDASGRHAGDPAARLRAGSEEQGPDRRLQGEEPGSSGIFVLPAYSAVTVIAKGIEKAGEADPEKVAEALRANTFETPHREPRVRREGRPEELRLHRLRVAQGRHPDRGQVSIVAVRSPRHPPWALF
ncbi:ABC transporter substrate-binding protein [Pseudomonas aeruginosa]